MMMMLTNIHVPKLCNVHCKLYVGLFCLFGLFVINIYLSCLYIGLLKKLPLAWAWAQPQDQRDQFGSDCSLGPSSGILGGHMGGSRTVPW